MRERQLLFAVRLKIFLNSHILPGYFVLFAQPRSVGIAVYERSEQVTYLLTPVLRRFVAADSDESTSSHHAMSADQYMTSWLKSYVWHVFRISKEGMVLTRYETLKLPKWVDHLGKIAGSGWTIWQSGWVFAHLLCM